TGFLLGVSVLLILNQLPVVTGRDADGGVAGAIQLLFALETVHMPSLVLAAIAMILALALPYTPVRTFGRLIAVVFPSAIVFLLGFDQVSLVRDSGVIPEGFPVPRLPPLRAFTPDIVTGAVAVAII